MPGTSSAPVDGPIGRNLSPLAPHRTDIQGVVSGIDWGSLERPRSADPDPRSVNKALRRSTYSTPSRPAPVRKRMSMPPSMTKWVPGSQTDGTFNHPVAPVAPLVGHPQGNVKGVPPGNVKGAPRRKRGYERADRRTNRQEPSGRPLVKCSPVIVEQAMPHSSRLAMPRQVLDHAATLGRPAPLPMVTGSGAGTRWDKKNQDQGHQARSRGFQTSGYGVFSGVHVVPPFRWCRVSRRHPMRSSVGVRAPFPALYESQGKGRLWRKYEGILGMLWDR